jgi:hypothetical protein
VMGKKWSARQDESPKECQYNQFLHCSCLRECIRHSSRTALLEMWPILLHPPDSLGAIELASRAQEDCTAAAKAILVKFL